MRHVTEAFDKLELCSCKADTCLACTVNELLRLCFEIDTFNAEPPPTHDSSAVTSEKSHSTQAGSQESKITSNSEPPSADMDLTAPHLTLATATAPTVLVGLSN